MGLWDWMLEAYGRPGAAQAALALQDEHGQNTCYLLWAAWGRIVDPVVLGHGAAAGLRWESTTLRPLREVRRALKSSFPDIDDAAREALRESVKAAELQAECVLTESLEALSGPAHGPASRLEALTAASLAWGKAAPREALVVLASVLD